MSKQGKILFGFGLLATLCLFAFRFVYGGWHDSMWVPLGLGVVLLGAGFVKDFKVLKAFFSMRTTKHGMNMGVLILLSVVTIACLNIFAVRYDKKWDLTASHLFSLSDQSVKAVESIKKETELVYLYRAGEQGVENPIREVREIANLFTARSDKIKFNAYNILRRPDLAKKFEFTFGPYGVFAVQGENHIRIEAPTEEGFTRALLKLGRGTKKVLYVTMGHGEFNVEGTDPDGLSQIRSDLSVTYDVKPLKLFEVGNRVPADAAVVAILRPQTQFLDAEFQGIRDYVKNGGRLLIAIDPGFRHNLAQLTKTYGIEFQNDFVIDQRSKFLNSGPVTVLGTSFSSTHEITRAMNNGSFAIFHLASSLKKAADASPALQIEPLVSTDEGTGTVAELQERIELKPSGPHVLGLVSTGPASGNDSKTEQGKDTAQELKPKVFEVVVFGDSDFISNRLVHNNLNSDLFLNSVSYLMSDNDLISIRPKEAEGTKLVMTAQSFNLLLVLFVLPLPFLLFFGGGFVWWRRKSA